MIVILDYGMGNLRSVEKAVQHLGAECRISDTIDGADKLILPGVGAFGAAMTRLAPLAPVIREHAAAGKPLLGICLGQQLLFEESEEMGRHSGLGLLKGTVRYLPKGKGLKVPNVGWSEVRFQASEPMATRVQPGDQVYFVHSLYTECGDPADIAATADHGIEFTAAVRHGNIWGTQFHPEKSGDVGLKILSNFLAC